MKRFIATAVIGLSLVSTTSNAGDIDVSKWLGKAKSLINELKSEDASSTSYPAAQGGEAEPTVISYTGNQLVIDYHRFVTYYDCKRRGFDYATFVAHADSGNFPRYEPFHKEPLLEKYDCPSQKKTSSYKKTAGNPQYHRGHGITSNHNDDSEYYMSLTNRMTNVVPHNGVQNSRGLWRHLEERVECARDIAPVTVYLGNYWGNDKSNDHFIDTHGVPTPDYIWRIHVYKNYPNQAFAWLIANDEKTMPEDENSARVSIDKLQQLISQEYDVTFPNSWVTSTNYDPYRNATCSLK